MQDSRPPEVDYGQPQREYEEVKLEDVKLGNLTVRVDKQLKAEASDTSDKALIRLKEKRGEALSVLPERARERLANIPCFLLYGLKARNGGKDNGLEYFQKDAPDHHPNLDSRWRDTIVVYCAENYVDITNLWALKGFLHEFAHAHHLGQWPENQPDIFHAWKHAKDKNLYRNVLDLETGKTSDSAYGLTNCLEYFAELSCMYCNTCNCEPSHRNKLKEAHDGLRGGGLNPRTGRPDRGAASCT